MDVLKGFTVVDMTMWAFVPSAGGVLSHWGANVIKIEHPQNADPMRLLAGSPEPGAASIMFKHYNRGKRGITLDLTKEEGREVLYKLVEKADVFLTSYLTDTRKKLKFDVADIRARNPRIIYAKGTGQGPKGPEAERGGYDGATFWGRGSLAFSAQQSAGIEWPPGMLGHGDGMSGYTLAGGICAALLKRERTGKTSIVDGSLMGTAVWYNGPQINMAKLPPDHPSARMFTGQAPRSERNPLGNTYRTKDNRFILFVMLTGDPDWVDLCQHVGRPDLANDPRFATGPERLKNAREAVRILDEWFSQHTFAEVKKLLAKTKGVWAPVQSAREIHDDPQTIANGFVRKVQYPNGQDIDLVVPPVLFDEDAGDPGVAPDWGQHTDAVLKELGMGAPQIDQLRKQGVIK